MRQLRAKINDKGDGIIYQRLTAYQSFLQALAGKEIIVTITEYRRNRTDRQNRYYWGVIVKMLSEYFGYDKDEETELHEGLKQKFLLVKGKHLEYVRSTRKLTTVEFNNYIDQIIRWAAKSYSVVLPDPDSWQPPEGEYYNYE